MKRRTKISLITLSVAVVVAALAFVWNTCVAPTRIAFVNYQSIQLGQIARSNDNSFIKIKELKPEHLDDAADYDMVFVNGMGLRITEDERAYLTAAAAKGTPVMTTAATNPQNMISSVDSVDQVFIKQYLAGGRENNRNLLRYVRHFIDGKSFKSPIPGDPVTSKESLLYYPLNDDSEQFASVAAFESYLQSKNKFNADAPKIILTGAMGVPDSLVSHLERSGKTVYPVNSIQQFIARGHADSLNVAAVINMAHGRMGDMVVNYLTRNNISLFSPLNVNRSYDEWMADKMGMSGGFLSQSIVTPEIDGAVRPFALFAHFEGDDGLQYVKAIPGRLEEFVATIDNYITLQSKPESEKKIAIFYFKGPGQNALVAEGMEVAPSLYNLLVRLKAEGYRVTNMPASASELEKLINENGKVFGSYAIGAQADFVTNNNPEIISREDYNSWCAKSLSTKMRNDIDAIDGAFPGHGLKTDDGKLALARLQFGNVVLIPQTSAGLGDDDFQIVHGTDAAPPHSYVAAYQWARYGFGADALIHFGAHGSLEFTPRKQVALSSEDWSDRLVGTMPHFYIYSTSNVGEGMIAKRRTYAGIINYLTAPFLESGLRDTYRNLSDAIAEYNRLSGADNPSEASLNQASKLVKKHTVEMGIHRELRLDSVLSTPYSADQIARIENFAEELSNEKITGALYTMGVPYSRQHINSTVTAMAVDPIAYSLYQLDKKRGRTNIDYERNRSAFTRVYVTKARQTVERLLAGSIATDDAAICALAGISRAELDSARALQQAIEGSRDMLSRMMVMGSMMTTPAEATAKIADRPATNKHKGMMVPGMSPEKALAMARSMGADSAAIARMKAAMQRGNGTTTAAPAAGHGRHGGHGAMGGMSRREISLEEMEFAQAITEVANAVSNVSRYSTALIESPENEMASLVNALNGGYIVPTSGGDPVLNPNILPTGRNMFAVNAEETPSAVAWEKGKDLANRTIDMYRQNHGDSIPRKVSYTLWSSEFIETEGATIAQVLYMLGVEPVRDPFGRVTDLRLIPSEDLGRPRIDVVVQTSGQLRDLAASRLFLISRAVKMAAEAQNDVFPNFVAEGVIESESHLVDKGISPREARELSTARVFGGVNGNYGSGIQGMVEAGDRWEDASEIAQTYMNNMGAIYGSEEDWEKMREFAFEAALTRTDVVVQPRQSNTWGALSLDHVYEFMGGMNLAVRTVTGKDPEAYLADYRNRNRNRMQEVKEAIGVESRTTILNPNYIREKMNGGAGDASGIADVIRNTYGWNVMKPDVIDNELWNDIYDTYVTDKNNLGLKQHFKDINPAALEEITAVMLETVRKGMWEASPEQVSTLAELHTEIVNEYKPSCSGFVCDNALLRNYIKSNVSEQAASNYAQNISEIRQENLNGGMHMQREELTHNDSFTNTVNGVIVAVCVIIALVVFLVIIRRRRQKSEL